MSLERCPECGHPTRVYADAGHREHEPGCSLGIAAEIWDSPDGYTTCRPADDHA